MTVVKNHVFMYFQILTREDFESVHHKEMINNLSEVMVMRITVRPINMYNSVSISK